MDLAAIDIGGTTIKIATWKNQKLIDEHAVETPETLEEFYKTLTTEVNKIKETTDIKGVGISAPGSVDPDSGIIGGTSAVPYIHNFDIVSELEKRFNLPVTIENDANSAALGELAGGSGKNCKSMAFFVIGTGIGGAIILDQKIWHGAHLYGGEFGYMLVDGNTLSALGSPIQLAKRYNDKTGKNLSGKEVFELADQGDEIAKQERHTMLHALAVAIFNIQHAFDPEKVILGGGISNNPKLLPLLNQELRDLLARLDNDANLMPQLSICELKSEANLRGAVYNFETRN